MISKNNFSVKKEELNKFLNNFSGEIFQVPPMYSAIKYKGKRLYELARNGIEIKIKSRKIKINNIKLLEFSEQEGKGKFFISCSKGTYIRTICNDLGEALGCGAVMTALCRTKACGFSLENSVSLEEIKKNPEILKNIILPVDFLFKKYFKVFISDSQEKRFKNGGSLFIDRIKETEDRKDREILRVYNKNFLGLGVIYKEKNELKVLKIF
jgi:tRNA pseudouridine55 synthase